MKTLDAATIKDMTEEFASSFMLTVMATLCMRFIRAYMAVAVWFQTIPLPLLSTFTYAPERTVNRVIHHCKFALFQRGGKQ